MASLETLPKRLRETAGADASLWALWGDRYLERQEPGKARCGQHALNNVIGSPQFNEQFFDQAVGVICGDEWRDDEAAHRRDSGWYSHGVLAQALQWTNPVQWVMSTSPLEAEDYRSLLDAEDCLGAIVNQGNVHWVAIVRHKKMLWLVNSVPPHLKIQDKKMFGYHVGPRTAYAIHVGEGQRSL